LRDKRQRLLAPGIPQKGGSRDAVLGIGDARFGSPGRRLLIMSLPVSVADTPGEQWESEVGVARRRWRRWAGWRGRRAGKEKTEWGEVMDGLQCGGCNWCSCYLAYVEDVVTVTM